MAEATDRRAMRIRKRVDLLDMLETNLENGTRLIISNLIRPAPPIPPVPPVPVNPDEFVFPAIDTQPDYLDTTPLPAFGNTATWIYIMIYMIADEEVGQWSDPVIVTVVGTP
jgi:hypothetical protein